MTTEAWGSQSENYGRRPQRAAQTMEGHMNARPDEKLSALCEIAKLTMDHMNTHEVAPAEAFLLGLIAGTAMRVPGVNQYLQDMEKRAAAAAAGKEAGQKFSRSWPPGVHGPKGEED